MEKRLILAIALSILVMISFQHFAVKPPPRPEAAQGGKAAKQTAPAIVTTKEAELKSHLPPEVLSGEKEFDVETSKYILTFSNVGGSIKRIRLKDYKDLNSDEPLPLVEIPNPKEYIFAISDPLNSLPLDSTLYEFAKTGDGITYLLKVNNLEVIKKYILHNSKYGIELQLIVKNTSDRAKEFSYRITSGSGLTESHAQDKRFLEARSSIDGKALNFKSPKNGRIINPGAVKWTALKSKYFSVILKPFVPTKGQFYNESKDGFLVTGVEPQEVIIPANSSIEHKFVIYAGPSQVSTLKDFAAEFEETIDYGFFGGISKALIFILGFFNRITHSWGVAIILLSIFLNVVLFPLSMKSFKSMQKMQELHPQMEKLKSQYKDNPQKLNKEIMELYKKYKINPFSGCLPMLLQMPIFLALYQALIRSIDLRCARFLYIKDLSMPDAVKIPISLPLIGNSINILPLLMIIAMVLQQKISAKTMGSAVTDEQKQQQQMMLVLMPIMFGFIFYNMPSGLVLYWVVNTMLTIAEQALVFKKA